MKRLLIAIAAMCALLYLSAPGARAQTVALSPVPHMQFLDANGAPLGGGCVFTDAAGSTTPLATYTDSTGSISNPNPIILDSGGFANIWLSGAAYKFAVYSNGGVSCATGDLQWTVDNITTATSSGGGGTATALTSASANPAGTGVIRLAASDTVCWRNAGNTQNLCLVLDGQNRLIWQPGSSFFVTQGSAPPVCPAATEGIYGDPSGRLGLCTNAGAGDLVVGEGTTDTFLNKTFDAAGVGNDFEVSGLQISSTTGTGAMVLGTSPTIASPTLSGTVGGSATYTTPTLTSPVINGTPSGTGIATTIFSKGTGSGDYATTSTSMVQVDATHLSCSGTVPTGWKLLASAAGVAQIPGGGGFGYLTLQDSINGVLQGDEMFTNNSVAAGGGPPSGPPIPFALQGVLNGDGMSHTVSLYWGKVSAGYSMTILNNSTAGFSVGPTMVCSLLPSN